MGTTPSPQLLLSRTVSTRAEAHVCVHSLQNMLQLEDTGACICGFEFRLADSTLPGRSFSSPSEPSEESWGAARTQRLTLSIKVGFQHEEELVAPVKLFARALVVSDVWGTSLPLVVGGMYLHLVPDETCKTLSKVALPSEVDGTIDFGMVEKGKYLIRTDDSLSQLFVFRLGSPEAVVRLNSTDITPRWNAHKDGGLPVDLSIAEGSFDMEICFNSLRLDSAGKILWYFKALAARQRSYKLLKARHIQAGSAQQHPSVAASYIQACLRRAILMHQFAAICRATHKIQREAQLSTVVHVTQDHSHWQAETHDNRGQTATNSALTWTVKKLIMRLDTKAATVTDPKAVHQSILDTSSNNSKCPKTGSGPGGGVSADSDDPRIWSETLCFLQSCVRRTHARQNMEWVQRNAAACCLQAVGRAIISRLFFNASVTAGHITRMPDSTSYPGLQVRARGLGNWEFEEQSKELLEFPMSQANCLSPAANASVSHFESRKISSSPQRCSEREITAIARIQAVVRAMVSRDFMASMRWLKQHRPASASTRIASLERNSTISTGQEPSATGTNVGHADDNSVAGSGLVATATSRSETIHSRVGTWKTVSTADAAVAMQRMARRALAIEYLGAEVRLPWLRAAGWNVKRAR